MNGYFFIAFIKSAGNGYTCGMRKKLTEYRRKRNFAETKEPSGEEKTRSKKNKKLRFVIQYHEARRAHYDLRLEWNGVLLSWAIPKGPSYNPRDKRLAVKVEDHPLSYADFEGIIPKGQYGGGTVMLWDEGMYVPNVDFAQGLQAGSLKFTLCGERMQGDWALVRMREKDGEAENWLLLKENDAFRGEEAGIASFTASVRTGRTMPQIARGEEWSGRRNPDVPATVALCRAVTKVPTGDEWLYEVKYDGYRIRLVTENGQARLYSRGGHDYTEKFSVLARAAAEWARGRAMILDGEAVIADEHGRTDFAALQAYEKSGRGEVVYMAFDLLAVDGEDLRALPLRERKQKLDAVLRGAPDCLRTVGYVIGRGRECAEAAHKAGLEGIVGKRLGAPYPTGRSDDWIKYKCYRRQEFVLGGYTRTQNKPEGISALLLGVYEEGKPTGALQYVGRAGTGLNRRSEADLCAKFAEFAVDDSPFATTPKRANGEHIFWLAPQLVGEVQFAEWTKEGKLRQASFKGLRNDKAAEAVVREDAGAGSAVPLADKRKKAETVSVCGVTVTHPDRIVYPDKGITKRDTVRYYEAAAERMLDCIGGRALSVLRCHEGVGGGCFFNKHPSVNKRAASVTIPDAKGKAQSVFCLSDAHDLIAEVQSGGLEFHAWGSRIETLERPDTMVFDLDPDENLPLAKLREGVRGVRSVLDELKLSSLLKTSGGKGYHIVVPVAKAMDWAQFRAFARDVARLLEEKYPSLYTSNVRKEKRTGKIFVDWGRNTRGATSVAAYSLRARAGAPVSMPIAWEELDTVSPDGIDLWEALERLRGKDPWQSKKKLLP